MAIEKPDIIFFTAYIVLSYYIYIEIFVRDSHLAIILVAILSFFYLAVLLMSVD